MVKNLNKVIIIIVIIICILIGILLVYRSQLKGEEQNNNQTISEEQQESPDSTPYELDDLKEDNIFFVLSDIIQSYYDNINKQNTVGYNQEERAEFVYNMLTPHYIESNNINKQNVFQVINQVNEEVAYTPISAKVKVEGNYTIYSMTGLLENINDNNKYLGEQAFYICVDNKNSVYAIEPIKNDTNIEEIEIGEIESNNVNKFQVKIMNVQEVLEKYMQNYKKMMLYYPERAFNLLDEEYRNTRFGGDVNQYKEYVDKYRQELKLTRLESYMINTYNDHTEYVCRDQHKNLYIFNTTATMKYSLKLDNYTILTEDFKRTYETSDDITKVRMNVERFVQMLNNHDYKSAYSLLDSRFKDNYFTSEEDFENYITTHYLLYNDVAYNDCTKEGDVYVCDIVMTEQQKNAEGEGEQMSIVMKLEEGTNFVMSFNVISMEEE